MSNMDAPPLSEEELNEIYNWVDTIPLTRPKKHIGRDFADGVLMAEIVAHFYPKLVELHNYSPAHSVQQKQYNWNTLNTKVFRKMGFQLTQKDVDAVIQAQSQAIERVLKVVQVKLQMYTEGSQNSMEMPKVQAQASNSGEKDILIQEQQETINILELKITKLEQLVKLKDSKIQTLMQKLQSMGYK